jgi:hypothetical protein
MHLDSMHASVEHCATAGPDEWHASTVLLSVACQDGSPLSMDDVAVSQALLLSCGRMMYFGPREGLVAWFSSLTYEWSARHGNVADWAMDLVNVGFDKGEGQVGWGWGRCYCCSSVDAVTCSCG